MNNNISLNKIQVGDDEFNDILEAEKKWIKYRRKRAETGEEESYKDTVGLALSGGGIRSATFNLGLMQSMAHYKFLKHVDYLSTVSGGGYIGSCLTWLMSKLKKFPFGTHRKDHNKMGGAVMEWLRSHGKYMTPGEGLNIWALMGAVITGVLVNLMVMIPIFLMLFFGLSQKTGFDIPVPGFLNQLITIGNSSDRIFIFLFLLGFIFLVLFLVTVFLYALSTTWSFLRTPNKQQSMRRWCGGLLKYSILLIIVGALPVVYHAIAPKISGWIEVAMSGMSVSGIITMGFGGYKKKAGNELKGYRSFLLSLGLSLLIYGLFLWFYHLVLNCVSLLGILIAAIFSLILALLANINHVSMHRFYRNRLMQAYMPNKFRVIKKKDFVENNVSESEEIGNPDKFLLKDIKNDEEDGTSSPYHIINTNVQTVGSKNYRLSGRSGDNFIFSPLYCGSDSTKFIKTEKYIGGNMNLATAFAISGAAVNPNTYATRSRPLSFLMTILNIRLGYWIRNPKRLPKHSLFIRPMWYYYMFAEMFGHGLSETQKQIHLSDGGHFENLGLYELIRRHCRYIVISDAGEDKGWNFGALGKVIEMVRLDFGAEIEIEGIDKLMPDEKTGISEMPFVHGTVTYNNGDVSDIFYIKTTMVKDLPEDLNCYRREYNDFPDQTTMDQFFDEKQFEAYRELGFQIGRQLFKSFSGHLKTFFSTPR